MSFCELYTFIAYLFVRTNKKDEHIEEEIATPVSTFNHSYKKRLLLRKSLPPLPPITEPVMLQEQIPKNQQCKLFKWMLEEKRKIKPKDPEEKKHIKKKPFSNSLFEQNLSLVSNY